MTQIIDAQEATRILETLGRQLDRVKPLRTQKTRSGVELRLTGRHQDHPVTLSITDPWKKLVILASDSVGKDRRHPVFVLESRSKRDPLATWAEGVFRTKGPQDFEDRLNPKVRGHIAKEFQELGLRRLRVEKKGHLRLEFPIAALGLDSPEKPTEILGRALALVSYLVEKIFWNLPPGKRKGPMIRINGIPLDVLQRKGESWKDAPDRVTCPYCHSKVVPPPDNHCPNCGAPLP